MIKVDFFDKIHDCCCINILKCFILMTNKTKCQVIAYSSVLKGMSVCIAIKVILLISSSKVMSSIKPLHNTDHRYQS